MSGRLRFLVTAGPTREPVDPVRYLSNRSSGRMGYAIAHAAAEAGYAVTLVSGPVSLEIPGGVDFVAVETSDDLYEAVAARIGRADVCIMTAAVADYRPARVAAQKIKKGAAGEILTLELERTRDILGSARGEMGFGGVLVGFAAETENVAANAREKLATKGCDLVCANDVSRRDIGFDSSQNELSLHFASGETAVLAKEEKAELGRMLVEYCVDLAAEKAYPD
ncbi:hypothetical protein BH23VER1_BH23VER1_26900 [soil metagenome]